jgi:long-chain acyl-CoA synthetase
MALTAPVVHETVSRLTAPGGPFEVTDRDVAGRSCRLFTHGAATLTSILSSGRGHGGKDFIVCEQRRWSFDRFFTEADALAAALQHDYGIRPGDRVAIAMRNCPDWLLTFTAAAAIGGVVVPVNSWGSADELQYTLRDCGAVLLAGDLPRVRLGADALISDSIPALLSEVEGPHTELPRDIAVQTRTISDAVSSNRHRTYTAAQPDPADPALLMYTSGSTGHPKGVIYRHIAVGQSLMHMMLVGFLAIEFGGAVELRGGADAESALLTVPLFHATGLFSGFLMPCIVGQKVALMRKWDAATAMRIIADENITMLSTVPAILKDLLTHPRLGDYDLSSITRVAAAGAATPADLPDLLRDKLGIVTRSAGYGMTETASVGATMSGPVFDLKPHSSGIPSPIIEIRAADPSGRTLGPGQDGEVQLRGVTVTPGYWRRDELNAEAFTDDGWLRTGDVGHLDEDGFVHITGRIKEIVIRGGENIAPIEIENVAYRHRGVKEVAVFGVPDDAMGEELALVCHPGPGHTFTEAELRDHLGRTLPGFKVPKYIVISEQPLPRNASEKIHRLALRNDFVAS